MWQIAGAELPCYPFLMPIHVSGLFIYPVKSLGGIALEDVEIEERGPRFDRPWMVVDGEGGFLTQRQIPKMATVRAEIAGGRLRLHAGDAVLDVPVPSGESRPVTIWNDRVEALPVSEEADAFLGDYLATQCRLIVMPETTRRRVSAKYSDEGQITSFADGFPLLLANTASLDDLNRRMPSPLPMARFRPNLVVAGAEAFAEDGWGRFRAGTAILEAVKPCTRCIITTIDQKTGARTGKDPLKTLASYRNTPKGVIFGENLVVVEPGKVRVGDAIEFLAPRRPWPIQVETPLFAE